MKVVYKLRIKTAFVWIYKTTKLLVGETYNKGPWDV